MLYSEFPAKRKTMLSNSTRGSTFGETPASLPREVRAQAKIRTMTKDNRKCRIVLTAIILQRGRASRSGSPLRVSKLTAAWYCDYREFRPHLNQHPRGTLIADLVDELATVPTIAPDLEDSGRLRRTVDEYIQVQGVRVAKGSSVGLARVWSARSTDQRQCNWLAPAKRRVAGIGGVIPRPEESLPRAPVLAVPLPWAPGRFCPRLNAYVTADSKQNSCAGFDATTSHSTG